MNIRTSRAHAYGKGETEHEAVCEHCHRPTVSGMTLHELEIYRQARCQLIAGLFGWVGACAAGLAVALLMLIQ